LVTDLSGMAVTQLPGDAGLMLQFTPLAS
jgi:hypothetical protein